MIEFIRRWLGGEHDTSEQEKQLLEAMQELSELTEEIRVINQRDSETLARLKTEVTEATRQGLDVLESKLDEEEEQHPKSTERYRERKLGHSR